MQAQRQPEVRIETALVKFVEDHDADAVERGVVLQSARQDALRHDLDARARADPRIAAHPVANGFADLFAAQVRQPRGGGARREATRLEHEQ